MAAAALPPPLRPLRVGVLGYGALGQHLVSRLLADAPAPGGARALELAFVWARDARKLDGVPARARLRALEDAAGAGADIVVEVAHPAVVAAAGAAILRGGADLLVGSPTALADAALEAALRAAAPAGGARRLLVPAGALWGSGDIARLGAAGRVAALSVTMAKHPDALAGLAGAPAAALAAWRAAGGAGACTLYDGPVRALAADAPANVNTMCAAALAAPALGFDGVRGVLVADASLRAHVITVELEGPRDAAGDCLRVRTVRESPAPPGAVSSTATLASFWASLRAAADAHGGPGGVIVC